MGYRHGYERYKRATYGCETLSHQQIYILMRYLLLFDNAIKNTI
eukprot:UN18919